MIFNDIFFNYEFFSNWNYRTSLLRFEFTLNVFKMVINDIYFKFGLYQL